MGRKHWREERRREKNLSRLNLPEKGLKVDEACVFSSPSEVGWVFCI